MPKPILERGIMDFNLLWLNFYQVKGCVRRIPKSFVQYDSETHGGVHGVSDFFLNQNLISFRVILYF